jgi:aerobic-type carbon monoxide dehydrogenase small subunit (CoxS/CutS family)
VAKVKGQSEKGKDFVCPYCNVRFDNFENLRSHIMAEHSGQSMPKPPGSIGITINGELYRLQVEPEWTLYHVIHDRLGYTGTKLMCDRGACGSCTVIMDGRSILSCMTLAIECDGKDIQTVEGIAEEKHPLIEEYIKHHCMQCGYCTPGFVVTAKNLLDKNPNPTKDEIREKLAGNLCRCGTYPQHPKAILEAARKMRPASEG